MGVHGVTGPDASHTLPTQLPEATPFAQAMQAAKPGVTMDPVQVAASSYQALPPRAGTPARTASVTGFEPAASTDKIGTHTDTLLAKGYARNQDFWILKNGAGPIPDQGWKIHISPAQSDDTVALAKSLFPKLRQAGVTHKIVQNDESAAMIGANQTGMPGNARDCTMGGTQHGKMVTLYANSEKEAAQLAALARDHIKQTGITQFLKVPNDQEISAGVSGRYGINLDHVKRLMKPDGTEVWDNRTTAKPDWVPDLVVPAKYNAHRAGHYAGPGTKPEPTHSQKFAAAAAGLGRGESFSIGRAPANDLESTSIAVSANHARVYRDTAGHMYIAEAGSANGTQIIRAGQAIAVTPGTPQRLEPGDTIQAGGAPGETYRMPGSTDAFSLRLNTLMDETGFSIGRDPASADLIDPNESVSGKHARIFIDSHGTLKVSDLGSANGTTVVRDGATVPVVKGTPVALRPGDVIQIGGLGYAIPTVAKATVKGPSPLKSRARAPAGNSIMAGLKTGGVLLRALTDKE